MLACRSNSAIVSFRLIRQTHEMLASVLLLLCNSVNHPEAGVCFLHVCIFLVYQYVFFSLVQNVQNRLYRCLKKHSGFRGIMISRIKVDARLKIRYLLLEITFYE